MRMKRAVARSIGRMRCWRAFDLIMASHDWQLAVTSAHRITGNPCTAWTHFKDSLVDPLILLDPKTSNFDRTPFSTSSLSYPFIVVVDLGLSTESPS